MNDWKIRKLSEIIPKAISGEWGDDVGETKVLRTTNFKNDGTINYSNVVMRSISQKKIDQKALKFGDTIIEKSGGSPSQPVGRVVYFDKRDDVFLCNNFTSVLRPSSAVNSKYIFWFLFNNHLTGKTLNYQNKTTGIINLKLERYLQELQIPIPPTQIQKGIAEILDKADALRKKDRQLIQYYDDLTQSLFINTFGDPVRNGKRWEIEKLGNYFKDGVKCGPFGSALKKHEFISEGVPVWNMDNIVKYSFEPQASLFISEEKFFDLSGYKVSNGDIIISRAGTVGKMCVVNSLSPNSIISTNLIKLSLDAERILPLYFVLLMKYFSAKIGKLKTGAEGSFTHMNTGILTDLLLPVPPIAVQNQFALKIQNIEQQKEKLKAQLRESENLFQTLLQQAFNGGLN